MSFLIPMFSSVVGVTFIRTAEEGVEYIALIVPSENVSVRFPGELPRYNTIVINRHTGEAHCIGRELTSEGAPAAVTRWGSDLDRAARDRKARERKTKTKRSKT